jgi:predicted dehydrogenase
MSLSPVTIGIIGCGAISSIYMENAQHFNSLNLVACADIDMERARAQAAKYKIPRVCAVEQLLADPSIELIVNLTVPAAHADVALLALKAGKSVYNEKPLATTREGARELLAVAQANGLRIGCAPDTFLGGGLQTCRALIDDGAIGEPIGATAFMMSHGPEGWHPNPDFFYQPGAGPMFDMGPYYLTALVMLLGPVKRVTGSTRISFPTRTIGSQPYAGQTIRVTTPTHIVGVFDFASGAIGNIITSFDVWASSLPRIEIYGSKGTLSVPDPNIFGGPVKLRKAGDKEWTDAPIKHSYITNSRCLGVAEMAYAMRQNRPHRAHGDMAYHILDVMQSFLDASQAGKHLDITSACERPQPLPANGSLEA